jgi:hypothetical protein
LQGRGIEARSEFGQVLQSSYHCVVTG